MERRPAKCPTCGLQSIAAILYGLPAFDTELQRDLAERRVVLGGCCIDGDDPQWRCNDCRHEWRTSPGLSELI